MKKAVCVLLCLAGCAALCSCSLIGGKKTAMTVAQAEIDNEVFAYYFDAAYSQAERDGGDLMDTKAIIESAKQKCLEYTASVTLFESIQLSLSADEKKAVSDNAENRWLLYGNYYTDAGISKQTVAKICLAEQYRTALLLYYFGTGSEYEVTESEIAHYFEQTYVAFRAINGYFTTMDEQGNTVRIDDAEALELRQSFENKRKRIAEGESMADVNDGVEVDSSFVAVESTAYPEGFLKKVSELEYDKPTVIETQDYIFLVIRLNAKTGEGNYYKNYRTRYVEALRGDMLTDMLIATGEEYGTVSNDKVIQKAAQTVLDARNSRK